MEYSNRKLRVCNWTYMYLIQLINNVIKIACPKKRGGDRMLVKSLPILTVNKINLKVIFEFKCNFIHKRQ